MYISNLCSRTSHKQVTLGVIQWFYSTQGHKVEVKLPEQIRLI